LEPLIKIENGLCVVGLKVCICSSWLVLLVQVAPRFQTNIW